MAAVNIAAHLCNLFMDSPQGLALSMARLHYEDFRDSTQRTPLRPRNNKVVEEG
jgi:hypothetical protein